MNYHHKLRRMTALLLALVLCLGLGTTAFAGQEDGYHDPAEHWMTSNNRTVELDVNSTVTKETFLCLECGKVTSHQVFRVPEYTRDGQTALTRNVKYSDGTLMGGEGKGATMDGTPGRDAYYTGYHWCKSICENCGHINSNQGKSDYCYGNNVYVLYDCAAEFMEELPETVTIEYADDTYHKVTRTHGDYCVFCYGTHHHEHSELVRHSMETDILPQLGHQRFAVVQHCTECEYAKYDFVAAKSVVADYYGVADGQPHTITVSDLSEAGVSTVIRYGDSAEGCTLTSAPNFVSAGQYNVYYAITYSYKGQSMTENGVAKVWLRDASTNVNGSEGCACGCGEPNCDCGSGSCKGCKHDCCASGKHNYVLLDTVKPTCTELGYARYFCTDCGTIEKRDYTNAIGHAWQSVVIREATCEVSGKTMDICRNCGEVKITETAKGEHRYRTYKTEATCTAPGYTIRECSVCGDRHIEDITAAKPHSYKASVIPATCDNGGKTIHSCSGCGSSFVTDYTQPLSHSWDAGKKITGSTCDGAGVTEYRCTRCGYHRLEGSEAEGHKPGPAATCTEPQVCTVCGVVLELPTGHKSTDWIIDKEATTEAEGEKHIECQVCHTVLEKAVIEKIYLSSVTDSKGEAVVGGYLVIVTDTDTKAPVAGASVLLNKGNTLAIRLPDARLLDHAAQTTVTVLLVKDKSPVADMFTAVSDKNENYSADKTDKAGQITVPAGSGYTSDGGKTTVGYEDPDRTRYTLTVKVEHYETGRPIPDAYVSIGKTGNITVKLPEGVDMDENHRIIVTVTDHKKVPQENVFVIVHSDLGGKADGHTDAAGKVAVPAVAKMERHGAYIYGYPDGTFGPSRGITRSEAAAIFARLLAEKNGDTLTADAKTKFEDIPAGAWYSGYVRYLSNAGIIYGTTEKTFSPNKEITRSEVTAIAVRFFEVYGDGSEELMAQYKGFSDISPGYWAARYIEEAAIRGWIKGYSDGTFRGDAAITRAEVVTIVNRLLGRVADKDFIDANLYRLNTFSDMSRDHWAFYDVMEASNTHTANVGVEKNWKIN